MWILSQDKKEVIFCKHIFICPEWERNKCFNKTTKMYEWIIKVKVENGHTELGTYDSEARAKEILLDIVKNLRENINYTNKEDDKLTGSCFVYEMPEK